MTRGTNRMGGLERDTFPPEMGKVRPGIVISGTVHNEVLNTLVIIPTSTVPPEIRRFGMSMGNLETRSPMR